MLVPWWRGHRKGFLVPLRVSGIEKKVADLSK